jgi:hypothetical protein
MAQAPQAPAPDDPEDQSFLDYVEALGHKALDPTSEIALELQAKYIATRGQHPFDALKSISQNPLCRPADRIGAAKALLEYSHRKVPTNFELSGKGGGAIKLDSNQLANLSNDELDTLYALLNKAVVDPAK